MHFIDKNELKHIILNQQYLHQIARAGPDRQLHRLRTCYHSLLRFCHAQPSKRQSGVDDHIFDLHCRDVHYNPDIKLRGPLRPRDDNVQKRPRQVPIPLPRFE